MKHALVIFGSVFVIGLVLLVMNKARPEVSPENKILEGRVVQVAQSAWAFTVESDGEEISMPFNLARSSGTPLPKPFPNFPSTQILTTSGDEVGVLDIRRGDIVRVEYAKNLDLDASDPFIPVLIRILEKGNPVYVNDEYGFEVEYPEGIEPNGRTTSTHLFSDGWNIYDREGMGESVVNFVLPESNEVLSAELRIGVSWGENGVESCLIPPEGIEATIEKINEISFIAFGTVRADMGDFGTSESYRTLHRDSCYAIDLIVYGAQPDTSPNSQKIPFTQREAMERLRPILNSFRFITLS